ncbi:MAG: VOC family protein [Holophagales bacterium]|nr:VOC family protein [Holophagales bacterium]
MNRNTGRPRFRGVYLFVEDLETSVVFYELLGLEMERVSEMFARASWGGHTFLELGTEELTRSYDPGFSKPALPPNSTLALEYSADGEVDAVFDAATRKGHESHLEPFTPPWGSRFAILIDPDGNHVGLHGPRDLVEDRARETDH